MGLFRGNAEAVRRLETPTRPPEQTISEGPGLVHRTRRVRLVACPLDELRPHPAYARHSLSVPADRLSALTRLGDLAFCNPLTITPDGIVLDGYARWELARLQGRSSLLCIEYDLAEDEALRCLIQLHGRSSGLNDFCRILLGLEHEPDLREAARANQQAGGESKGSTKLTEAQRRDVRQQIAATAGVSVGNVSKVKEILTKAVPEIIVALKNGDTRIHRAWQWVRFTPAQQRAALEQYRSQKGVSKAIGRLVSRHKRNDSTITPENADLVRLLRGLESRTLDSVNVFVIQTPGRTIFLTEELVRSLSAQKELQLRCDTNSR